MVFSYSSLRVGAALFCALCVAPLTAAVQGATLDGMQTYSQDGYTKLLMDFTGEDIDWQTSYEAKDPHLLVTLFDTENNMHKGIEYHNKSQGFLDGISLVPKGKDLSVRVDLNQPINYTAYKLSKPSRLVFILTKHYESNEVDNVVPGMAYSLRKSLGHYGPLRSHLVAVDKDHSPVFRRYPLGDKVVTPTLRGISLGLERHSDRETSLPIDAETLGQGVLSYDSVRGYTISRQDRHFIAVAGSRNHAIDGINRTRHTDELILYTGARGMTTNTNSYGIEATVKDGHIVAIKQGNSPILPGATVLSAHGKAMAFLQGLKVGDRLQIKEREPIAAIQSNRSLTFTGGLPLMIDGKVLYGGSPERSGHTMLAVTKGGQLIILTMEGPNKLGEGGTTADGMSLLRNLGAWSIIELYPNYERDLQVDRFYKRQSGAGYEYVLTVL